MVVDTSITIEQRRITILTGFGYVFLAGANKGVARKKAKVATSLPYQDEFQPSEPGNPRWGEGGGRRDGKEESVH